MKFIADFHLHSHYSIATSKDLTPGFLDYWARLKGITVVGTGDFTHRGWTEELKEYLEPAEPGLFKLKQNLLKENLSRTSFLPGREVRFILSAEISNIYKKNGRVRKVHNVILAPDFETVEKIQRKLTGMGGNLTSDGRPILGMDSRDLLEVALEASPEIFFIPAHIWTPWFSILGSKSGFDSVKEAFEDLSSHIYAVETGLSTDPAMNWMCSFLDNYTLISNSDAHSPEKLGRNANRFNTSLCYKDIVDTLKTGDPLRFLGSIDLFPQEGKYHYDGHRKCGVCWNPLETLQHNGICNVCGKKVTVGVMNRVVQLSDREDIQKRKNRHSFSSIIPLKEILSELTGSGTGSGKVEQLYMSLIKRGIPELELLLDTEEKDIVEIGGDELAEAIFRMRKREIYIREGYDGEFGVIKVFDEKEMRGLKNGKSLFKDIEQTGFKRVVPPERKMIDFDLEEFRRLRIEKSLVVNKEEMEGSSKQDEFEGLNVEQYRAVKHFKGPSLVIAGPGTGKTRVLTYRIMNLIKEHGVKGSEILGITFTNKAAGEIRERLNSLFEENNLEFKDRVHVMTFHALGYSILEEKWRKEGKSFLILDGEDKEKVIGQIGNVSKVKGASLANSIEKEKQLLKCAEEVEDRELGDIYRKYENFLESEGMIDLGDLLYKTIRYLEHDTDVLKYYRNKYKWILIDEYQDINYAQYMLIRLLMREENSNICAIGDPDQAIYGFRGADVQYMKQFCEDYREGVIYRLKQSYRCSDSILRASNNVMQRGDKDEALLTGLEKGVKIKIVKHSTYRSEAEFVARTIEQMMGGLRFFSMDSDITEGDKEEGIESLSDFVILYRIKDELDAVEKALQDHSIPYEIVGETPFFKEEPIVSILRILEYLKHGGNTFLREMLKQHAFPVQITIESLDEFVSSYKQAGELIEDIINGIIEGFFKEIKEEKKEEIKRLLDLAKEYGNDMGAFLRFMKLGTGVDTYRGNLENVTLMTLHGAKGLEFGVVFIVGCEDGLIPYSIFKNHEGDIEEERRLLYVGMTRAKKFLYLCHADKRMIYGREYQLPRSRFLDSIEKNLIELSKQEIKKKDERPMQRKLFEL